MSDTEVAYNNATEGATPEYSPEQVDIVVDEDSVSPESLPSPPKFDVEEKKPYDEQGAPESPRSDTSGAAPRGRKGSVFDRFFKRDKEPTSAAGEEKVLTKPRKMSVFSMFSGEKSPRDDAENKEKSAPRRGLAMIVGLFKSGSSASGETKATEEDKKGNVVDKAAIPHLVPQVEKSEFEMLLDKIKEKDKELKELVIKNSKLISDTPGNFALLAQAMTGNTVFTNVQLENVSMTDEDCILMAKALATCTNIRILNLEWNLINSDGMEALAYMMEKHPNLRELRLMNQGVEMDMKGRLNVEMALANGLSQNLSISKINFHFSEPTVKILIDKYIERNMEIKRGARVTCVKAGQAAAAKSATTRQTGVGRRPSVTKREDYPFPTMLPGSKEREEVATEASLSPSSVYSGNEGFSNESSDVV